MRSIDNLSIYQDISQFDGLELMVYDRNCEKYKVLIELRKCALLITSLSIDFFL